MAYYFRWRTTKVLIEVWCDWDPAESDLKEFVGHVALGENTLCTFREVVKVVDRPQDIARRRLPTVEVDGATPLIGELVSLNRNTL